MGRKRSKRGSGKTEPEPHTPEIEGLVIPEGLSETAKEYYEKFGVKFNTEDKPVVVTPTASSTTTYGTKSTWKSCKHFKQKVKLAPGVVIMASGTRHYDKKLDGPWTYPEVGVYFDGGWDDFSDSNAFSTSWKGPKTRNKVKMDSEIAVIKWKDFGAPDVHETRKILDILEYALNKAGEGKQVEIGCIGAHGRTGTAMAAMLLLLGERDADKAMEWVWNKYCSHAIETTSQEDWLWTAAEMLYPDESPAIHQSKLAKKAANLAAKKTEKSEQKDSPFGHSQKSESSTLDLETLTEDEYWLARAYDQYKDIRENYPGDQAEKDMKYVAYTCGVGIAALEDYIANQELTDKVDDDDSFGMEEWQEINQLLLAEGNKKSLDYEDIEGTTRCALCDQPIRVCTCFKEGVF